MKFLPGFRDAAFLAPMRVIAMAWMCLSVAAGHAAELDQDLIRERYQVFVDSGQAADNPLPFWLKSDTGSTYSTATTRYFLEDVSIATLSARLSQPAEWCEFIPLHLNIKTCIWFTRDGQNYLRFYVGIKGYQTPDDAHLLQLKFDAGSDDSGFRANLFAADGPLDSSNIDFEIRAIEISDGARQGVYLEFDLSSVPGLAANLAKLYLATIARGKIGFSTEGKTWTGKPKYVGGQRGAAERNLVRYLLAIETYFDTIEIEDPAIRFEQRLENWFDATEEFAAQLHELERDEYLSNKRRERKNQILLQSSLGQAEPDFKNRDERR